MTTRDLIITALQDLPEIMSNPENVSTPVGNATQWVWAMEVEGQWYRVKARKFPSGTTHLHIYYQVGNGYKPLCSMDFKEL